MHLGVLPYAIARRLRSLSPASLTSIAGSVGVFRHPSRLDEEESLALVGRVQERTKATPGLLVVLTAGTLRALGTVLNLGLF